jgi:hypothetical protein
MYYYTSTRQPAAGARRSEERRGATRTTTSQPESAVPGGVSQPVAIATCLTEMYNKELLYVVLVAATAGLAAS